MGSSSISQPTLKGSSPNLVAKAPPPPAHSGPVIYSRDFAYVDNGPVVVVPTRMVRTDILTSSAKTFAGLLSGPLVDIRVGSEGRQWSLHRNLLCHHSTFFETEFGNDSTPQKSQTKDNKLDLRNDDPIGFELLVKWLYQGQLEDTSHMSDEAKYDYAVACHKLYLLCDKFDMVRLKNIAMDQYRRCLHEAQLVPDANEINEIYRASPAHSPFRTLMIKIAARQIMDPDIDRDAEAYRKCFEDHPEFAVDMVNAVRYMSGGILFDDPTLGDSCSYHDHSDVSGCQLEGKGKARTAEVGAVNGQGLSARRSEAAPHSHLAMPAVAELSTERRTPRKLHAPSSSPRLHSILPREDFHPSPPTPKISIKAPIAIQVHPRRPSEGSDSGIVGANTSSPRVPRSEPRKLEKRGGTNSIPAQPRPSSSTVSKNASDPSMTEMVQSPFDSKGSGSSAPTGAAIRPPPANELVINANNRSPLMKKTVKIRPTTQRMAQGNALSLRRQERKRQTYLSFTAM